MILLCTTNLYTLNVSISCTEIVTLDFNSDSGCTTGASNHQVIRVSSNTGVDSIMVWVSCTHNMEL